MTDTNGGDRLNRIEEKLKEIAENLSEFRSDSEDKFSQLDQRLEDIDKRLEKFDNRIFEMSMRSMLANSSAFFGIGIAILSAIIAYVVSVVSQKNPL